MLKAAVKFIQKVKADAKTSGIIDANMPALALMFEAEAKRRTPVQTGRLKNGFQGHRTGFLKAVLSNNVEYAQHVEFGTSKMAPRAMIRQAAAAMKELGLNFLKDKLKQANHD